MRALVLPPVSSAPGLRGGHWIEMLHREIIVYKLEECKGHQVLGETEPCSFVRIVDEEKQVRLIRAYIMEGIFYASAGYYQLSQSPLDWWLLTFYACLWPLQSYQPGKSMALGETLAIQGRAGAQ